MLLRKILITTFVCVSVSHCQKLTAADRSPRSPIDTTKRAFRIYQNMTCDNAATHSITAHQYWMVEDPVRAVFYRQILGIVAAGKSLSSVKLDLQLPYDTDRKIAYIESQVVSRTPSAVDALKILKGKKLLDEALMTPKVVNATFKALLDIAKKG